MPSRTVRVLVRGKGAQKEVLFLLHLLERTALPSFMKDPRAYSIAKRAPAIAFSKAGKPFGSRGHGKFLRGDGQAPLLM